MKDRIKRIMEHENLTPARFADKLQINRAIISHILNGRNNPSLDVVTKILGEMEYINSDWLLTGKGKMYKEGFNADSYPTEPDLFHEDDVKQDMFQERAEKQQEPALISSGKQVHQTDNKQVKEYNQPDRKIAQIIIYYNDQTFETFRP